MQHHPKKVRTERGQNLTKLLFSRGLSDLANTALKELGPAFSPAEKEYLGEYFKFHGEKMKHAYLAYICVDSEQMVKESQEKLRALEVQMNTKARKARVGPRRQILIKTLSDCLLGLDIVTADVPQPMKLFELITARGINRDIGDALIRSGDERRGQVIRNLTFK